LRWRKGRSIKILSEIAKEIRVYTNGYPYLVSRICQHIDEKLDRDWTLQGIQKTVNRILVEQSTLFDDLFKNIESNPDLKELLRELTIGKRNHPYIIDNQTIHFASMFGIVEERGTLVAIHNRIFEVRIKNYFASEKDVSESNLMQAQTTDKRFTQNLGLSLKLCAISRSCQMKKSS
jgi:hypothetical protein